MSTQNNKQPEKPKQRRSWAGKIANNYKFFRDTADYIISNSKFGSGGTDSHRIAEIQMLRDIYYSKFPTNWFSHVTNPYGADGSDVKSPAKIRPLNIIKPNIDYLKGEYTRRPFPVMISNLGDHGYDSYIEGLKEKVYKELSKEFINTVNEEMGEEATGVESMPTSDPQEVAEKYAEEYKNELAVQADTDLNLIIEEQSVEEKFEDQFFDYIRVGECFSYKNVERDETVYETVPPEEIDYKISKGLKYIKDSSWVVRRREVLRIDLQDMFYDALEESDLKKLEGLTSNASGSHTEDSHLSLYHVCWRSEEKVGIRTYFEPITGELEMDEVSEDYVVDELSGETVEWIWRSRWLEVYRIGDSDPIYLNAGKVRYSPNFINNLAKTEGPYNGKKFAPDASKNTSILKLGIPFLISYIIGHFALERIIARNGDKIVLIDKNVIPRKEGWSEAKFFQMAGNKGWGLIDRSQVGADKSFNQYQVVDMSMYDHISKIIEVMDFCERQYETQIGIVRQAKGDVAQRDSVNGTRAAISQSTIVTETIFSDFEKYKLTEYQGLLHCSQISAIYGKRRLYTSSDGRQKLLELNPAEYPLAQLGVRAVINPLESEALEKMRAYGQALAQNGVEASTLIEIETARSIPRLKQLLLETEETRRNAEAQAQQAEAENSERLLSLEQEFRRIEHALDLDSMHQEYDRKQDLVVLQGDINMAMTAAETGVNPETANPALNAYMDYQSKSDKIEADMNIKNKQRLDKNKLETRKLKIAEEDAKHARKLKENESRAKVSAIKTKAKQQPKAVKSK